MNKIKSNLNDYKIIIVVLLTVFQLCIMCYYFNLKSHNNMSQELTYTNPIKVSFNEVFDSLNSIENLEILEMEDLDNEWYIKVSITGEEGVIIKAIDELKTFKIYNYDITGNEGVLSVIMELYR